jgi:hypothetical protein
MLNWCCPCLRSTIEGQGESSYEYEVFVESRHPGHQDANFESNYIGRLQVVQPLSYSQSDVMQGSPPPHHRPEECVICLEEFTQVFVGHIIPTFTNIS